jgi:hypothetical protein
MPEFHIYGAVSGTKYLGKFRAATKEEAIDLASNEDAFVSLCHQCSSECEDAEIHSFVAEEAK